MKKFTESSLSIFIALCIAMTSTLSYATGCTKAGRLYNRMGAAIHVYWVNKGGQGLVTFGSGGSSINLAAGQSATINYQAKGFPLPKEGVQATNPLDGEIILKSVGGEEVHGVKPFYAEYVATGSCCAKLTGTSPSHGAYGYNPLKVSQVAFSRGGNCGLDIQVYEP